MLLEAGFTELESKRELFMGTGRKAAQQKKAAARGGQKQQGGGAISKRKASSEVEALHGKIGDALSLLGTMLD